MKFCTVINCMDGRIQLPVINYLKKRFKVDYVDSITEAGPNSVLSQQKNNLLVESIIKRLKISVENHSSVGIAIVGHFDCAGNPADYKTQIYQIRKSMNFIKKEFNKIEIVGLWVNGNWEVQDIENI